MQGVQHDDLTPSNVLLWRRQPSVAGGPAFTAKVRTFGPLRTLFAQTVVFGRLVRLWQCQQVRVLSFFVRKKEK